MGGKCPQVLPELPLLLACTLESSFFCSPQCPFTMDWNLGYRWAWNERNQIFNLCRPWVDIYRKPLLRSIANKLPKSSSLKYFVYYQKIVLNLKWLQMLFSSTLSSNSFKLSVSVWSEVKLLIKTASLKIVQFVQCYQQRFVLSSLCFRFDNNGWGTDFWVTDWI